MEVRGTRDLLGSTRDGADRRGRSFIWGDALETFRCLRRTPEGDGQFNGTQRSEHPDYELDLNFKKAKAEAVAEQQSLI